MDTASQVAQALGLLAILAGASLVFIRIVRLIIGKRRHSGRIGFEFLLFFTVLYIFAGPALALIGLATATADVQKGTAFLWWVTLAFTVNASLKRFVWDGILSVDGTRKVPKILTDGIGLLLYAVAVMIVMHFVFEEPITAVLATSGAAAFIVGLSAQSTMREVFSGVALNSTKALRLGDYVEIDGIYGRVHEINWRSVSLHNPHTDSLYIFPNSAVADRIILNYCEPTGRFKNIVKFVVEYSTSPELVMRTVMDALEHSRFVLREPKPDIHTLGFTDLGMEYRIRYFFDGDEPWWDAQNEICMAIWSSLRRKGIRLSIDRHKLQSGDELADTPWTPSPRVAVADDLVSLLHKAPVLSKLEKSELQDLAQQARRRDFTPPDCLFCQGDQDGRVYFLAEGLIAAMQTQADGKEVQVGTFGKGTLLGLDTLVSEDVRKVTLQALYYSVVYELEAEPLRRILEDKSELHEKVEAFLAEQDIDFADGAAAFAEEQRHREHQRHRMHLSRHIRQNVEALLARPIFHRAMTAILPSRFSNEILEAVMAACALVSSARGEIDEPERAYVHDALAKMDLFKHADRDHGLEIFEKHASRIRERKESGIDNALSAISRVSSNQQAAHVVMGSAHGITSVHGKITLGETEMVDRIAQELGLSPDIGELVNAVAAQSERRH
jgi:small-conductance mechanosensitive channel/tellurite resistance protein